MLVEAPHGETMIYRGFKIERVICHNNAGRTEATDDGTRLRIVPHQRIEYVISESVAGFHWEEIGSANSRAMAKEMIDRVVTVRQALAGIIGIAI